MSPCRVSYTEFTKLPMKTVQPWSLRFFELAVLFSVVIYCLSGDLCPFTLYTALSFLLLKI